MSAETLKRNTYYKDSDFTLEYEVYEGTLLLHCEVNNWTPSVLRRGYSIFADLVENAIKKGYDKLMTVTPNPHFAKMFNGETVRVVYYLGKEYEVIEWDLKPQL